MLPRLTAARLDRGRLPCVRDVEHGETRSLLGEAQRDRATDPLGGARDDGNAAAEVELLRVHYSYGISR